MRSNIAWNGPSYPLRNMLRSNTEQEILCQKELVTDLRRARSLLRKRSKDFGELHIIMERWNVSKADQLAVEGNNSL